MEDRRADAQQRPAQQQHRVMRRERQSEQATHGDGHAEWERIRLRFTVGVEAHQWLQERRRDLEDER